MTNTIFALCYLPDIERFTIMNSDDAADRVVDFEVYGIGIEHVIVYLSKDKRELEWIVADHFARLN